MQLTDSEFLELSKKAEKQIRNHDLPSLELLKKKEKEQMIKRYINIRLRTLIIIEYRKKGFISIKGKRNKKEEERIKEESGKDVIILNPDSLENMLEREFKMIRK